MKSIDQIIREMTLEFMAEGKEKFPNVEPDKLFEVVHSGLTEIWEGIEKRLDAMEYEFLFGRPADKGLSPLIRREIEKNTILIGTPQQAYSHLLAAERKFNLASRQFQLRSIAQDLNKLTLLGKRDDPKPAKRKRPYPVPKKKRGKRKNQ